jgi:hypothetical protein
MLISLNDLSELDFPIPTNMERWTDIRRVLLRFGDHMREHANQIEGVRDQNNHIISMPQRMLAEGEIAWGKLLAATTGLSDADLDMKPPDGGWTVRQVLEHILKSEKGYFEAIIKAIEKGDFRTGRG